MTATTSKLIYSGKAKDIFETEDPEVLKAYFRDSATAFNAQKKGIIQDKGKINATISAILFKLCEQNGIITHFIKQLSENELLIKRVKIVPLEVIVRNIAAGSLCKRLGVKEGKLLKTPIVEFNYKSDELGDPLLTRDYIKNALEIANDELLDRISSLALRINELFKSFFFGIGLKVVDFKLEFGFDKDGELLLADELSPDNFRLWDEKTNEKMDKDRFRLDLGNVEGVYKEVLERIQNSNHQKNKTETSDQILYSVKVQVLPKKDILDPQGQAVEKALKSLNFKNVSNLKIGKEIVFNLEAQSKPKANEVVKEMCEKLLANPVIEDYKIEII